jgi:UDP-3-O-acyl-N-acetylglucosamine deacetylase
MSKNNKSVRASRANLDFFKMKKNEKKYRSTIQAPCHFQGKGLHFASQQSLTLRPTPPNTGILLNHQPIDQWHVKSAQWATQLEFENQTISTIEHLLGAIYIMQIDDISIELDGNEIPILDGSALPFYEKIKRTTFDQESHVFLIDQNYHFKYLESDCTLKPTQTDEHQLLLHFDLGLSMFPDIQLIIDPFDQSHPNWMKVMSARTFGFRSQEKKLRDMGLIQGVGLDNCVIFDDLDPQFKSDFSKQTERVMPSLQTLRFEHEYAYHKVLDFFGDLMRMNQRLKGNIHLTRGSHALHAQIVDCLLLKLKKHS